MESLWDREVGRDEMRKKGFEQGGVKWGERVRVGRVATGSAGRRTQARSKEGAGISNLRISDFKNGANGAHGADRTDGEIGSRLVRWLMPRKEGE